MFTILDNIANTYCVQLDAAHPIYAAHFPGRPITPGVCILEMAHRVAEQYADKKLTLVRIKSVKFISVLDPALSPTVTVTITAGLEKGDLNSVVNSEAGGLIAKISAAYE